MTHRAKLSLFAAALAVLTLAAGKHRGVTAPTPPVITGPTFNKEVVRIFQQNCQTCHHPGDIAPFSLMTYADAQPHAFEIKAMTSARIMPPWKPVASCGVFNAPRTLSSADIATIGEWVKNGAPEGNASDLPTPLDFSSGWVLGQPDFVAGNAKPFTPPGDRDEYHCYSMPTNLTSDKYVSAIDVHPGDRTTVHHVIAFIDTTGESAKLDTGNGYQCFGGPGFAITNLASSALGGWAPGTRPDMLPDNVGFLLPANSRIVLQVHYHPHDPNPKPDQTEIGLYFHKKQPAQVMLVLPLINDTFTIPPGDSNYKVGAAFTNTLFNAHIWFVAPHMHLLGKRMSVDATLPNGGGNMCLINISDWDFNWQGMYRYQQPVAVPVGTKLSLSAFYDNSPDNPKNPNTPPRAVSWGEATTDEMCIAFLGVTLDGVNPTASTTVSDLGFKRVVEK